MSEIFRGSTVLLEGLDGHGIIIATASQSPRSGRWKIRMADKKGREYMLSESAATKRLMQLGSFKVRQWTIGHIDFPTPRGHS